MEILFGAHVLMTWYFNKDELCGHDQIIVERTIQRNPEWVKLFFTNDGVILIGDELLRVLTETKQGKLLSDAIYWALHK